MKSRRQQGVFHPTSHHVGSAATATAKLSQLALNAEQQAEAELIHERIRGAFDEEARRLAPLMASKETRHIFGQTWYQIRDRVHAIGSQVLEAVAQECL